KRPYNKWFEHHASWRRDQARLILQDVVAVLIGSDLSILPERRRTSHYEVICIISKAFYYLREQTENLLPHLHFQLNQKKYVLWSLPPYHRTTAWLKRLPVLETALRSLSYI